MKILGILLCIGVVAIFSCKNNHEQETLSSTLDESSIWLEDGVPLPESDSLFYLEHPAPLFRKSFRTKNEIESATLSITAAGYYKASINGQSIKGNVLDPAWTDFTKRIYYSDYDVSAMLQKGENCLGVSLGNGFYNPLPMRKWGRRNMRTDLSVGKPVFTAKLTIKYKDGSIEEIVTDDSWKYALGPILRNSVYIGVSYDANKEIEGWDKIGFDDSNWKVVTVGKAPGGQLEKAFFPAVEIVKDIVPVDISGLANDVWIVDMGVNFTGTFKMKVSGEMGDTVHFLFGERIYEDGRVNPMTTVAGQIKKKGVGGPGAPDVAWQTDSYIIGPQEEQWFSPDFTYHTYRYMEIKGLESKPKIEDIHGLFMHSNVENKSSFSTSSALLNDIQEISVRTFLANLVSVQSDCPAREKFGYGGDLNATSETFIYNFDMQSFYRKTIYDWVDAMKDSSFVDTAPFTGVEYCGISWESAFLTTQYVLYLYYNDTEIVRELYELDKKWMEKVAIIHPAGMVEAGLSDHESLEPVPVQLTGTAHYLQCARIMKTFASLMKDVASEKKYADLAHDLERKIKEEFWDKPYEKAINRQTLFSTLIYHKLIPEDEMEAAVDSLMKAIKNGPSGHFNTGIFGTKYVLESLAEYGDANTVFDIVNSTKYPGWGHMIDQSATTIWETWKESDNTFSNNHPMFGTVSEWYYRWLAGIQPDPHHPGFEQFLLTPTVPEKLASVSCYYDSPHGKIVSNWKRNSIDHITYEFTIPKGSAAEVRVTVLDSQKVSVSGGSDGGSLPSEEALQAGAFSLVAGKYVVEVRGY